MGPFVVRRLLTVVAIIPVITLLVFLMRVLVPGDPVEIMFMGQSADRATIERVRRELGWDRPIAVQYAEYVGQLARGDLGRSIQNNRPVAEDLRARYPLTLLLAVGQPGPRHDAGPGARRPGRALPRAPPRRGRDGAGRGGDLDAVLLARAAPHQPRQRALGAAPGHGRRVLAASRPAGRHAGRPVGGRDRPPRPLEPPRDARPGLHSHRVGQGAARPPRGRQARAPRRR